MITAGIRETKARLSSLLAAVRSGEEVLITDRGRPVARIVKEPARARPIEERLEKLADTGFLTLRNEPHRRDRLTTYRLAGTPLSRIVAEDRR